MEMEDVIDAGTMDVLEVDDEVALETGLFEFKSGEHGREDVDVDADAFPFVGENATDGERV